MTNNNDSKFEHSSMSNSNDNNSNNNQQHKLLNTRSRNDANNSIAPPNPPLHPHPQTNCTRAGKWPNMRRTPVSMWLKA